MFSMFDEKPEIKTKHLRWYFLAPVMTVIVIMVSSLVATVYRHAEEDIKDAVADLSLSAVKIYENNLQQITRMLGGILEAVSGNEKIIEALKLKDHEQLLMLSKPMFAKLQREYEISHFYFTSADRTVLLRVHKPDVFGDTINRATTVNAQLTKSPAHGVEMGVLGTLTLRYVMPIYADRAQQQAVGFIELGVDTGHVLSDVQKSLGTQLFEFISKELIRRDVWEEHIVTREARSLWNAFNTTVPGVSTLQRMTPELSAMLNRGIHPRAGLAEQFSHRKAIYRVVALPLKDMSGRSVGHTAMLINVSREISAKQNVLYLGLILGLAGCGTIFGLFWRLTGRVGALVEGHHNKLHHFATHDGLTGLFNHRAFHVMLGDEIARSKRYGTPVSLLMLDLDHFKQVNDTFGHMVGDKVLVQVGQIICAAVRDPVDRVCRYGGEEFSVILPETRLEGALTLAERLRAEISKFEFDIGNGTAISITVSIGVTVVTEEPVLIEDLIRSADQALYAAKDQGRNQVCSLGSAAAQREKLA